VRAEPADPVALRSIISAPVLGRWREYADAAWFEDHEARCEEVLADFLRTDDGLGLDNSIGHRVVDVLLGDRNGMS
jgi:hypothetical protein